MGEKKSEYTEQLAEYPYTDDIANSEGFRPKRYVLGNETSSTIGYGHQINDEKAYTKTASNLSIKDKENLTPEEGKKLLNYDIDLRRYDIKSRYKDADQELLDVMLNVSFQFGPKGFDEHFGDAITNGDITGIQSELKRLGQVFKDRGMGGVDTRWQGVSKKLDKLKPKPKQE